MDTEAKALAIFVSCKSPPLSTTFHRLLLCSARSREVMKFGAFPSDERRVEARVMISWLERDAPSELAGSKGREEG
jgi:hypothetical protein